jgi:uncharacterized protein YkwD
MTRHNLSLALLGSLGALLGACNMITGADGVVLVEDDDESSSGVGSTSAGGGSGGTSAVGGSGAGAGAGGTDAGGTGTGGTGAGGTGAGGTGAGGTGGTLDCGGAGPTTTPLDAEELAFLDLINDYRAQNGLGSLTHCISLDRAAQGHSEDMRDLDYFDHIGLDGRSPWERACDACFDLGCGPSTAMAENIAAGNSGAAATFQQWQNSPGHNANMLGSSFHMIGIGRATGGGTYGVYWTNVFAGNDEPSCY